MKPKMKPKVKLLRLCPVLLRDAEKAAVKLGLSNLSEFIRYALRQAIDAIHKK